MSHGLIAFVAVVIVVLFSRLDVVSEWDERAYLSGLLDPVPGFGRIDEIGSGDVSRFFNEYWDKKPVIIRGGSIKSNWAFSKLVTKARLRKDFGNSTVILSTANTNSYDKTPIVFREYIDEMMGIQDINRNGVDTLYLFGDNSPEITDRLLPHYENPTTFFAPGTRVAHSFGLSGSGTGVPFHTHGPVFAEVFFGRKRWFVSDQKPRYNGSDTTLRWLRQEVPSFTQEERQIISEGICSRGDLLYLPLGWYHSTLNIGQTVFMSAFI